MKVYEVVVTEVEVYDFFTFGILVAYIAHRMEFDARWEQGKVALRNGKFELMNSCKRVARYHNGFADALGILLGIIPELALWV